MSLWPRGFPWPPVQSSHSLPPRDTLSQFSLFPSADGHPKGSRIFPYETAGRTWPILLPAGTQAWHAVGTQEAFDERTDQSGHPLLSVPYAEACLTTANLFLLALINHRTYHSC